MFGDNSGGRQMLIVMCTHHNWSMNLEIAAADVREAGPVWMEAYVIQRAAVQSAPRTTSWLVDPAVGNNVLQVIQSVTQRPEASSLRCVRGIRPRPVA